MVARTILNVTLQYNFVVFVSTDKQVTKQYCYKDFLLNVMTVGGKNSSILWERIFNTYVKGSN
jgi:hypothetical protein